ncbi:MAG: ATPase, T2SS/T4P/T4SS family [Candidatus Falkowbacteria bacterium]
MSKKIIKNLFNYAAREGAKDLIIEGVPEKIALHYRFADGEERSFGLPKKLEKDLSLALRQILKLAPDELTTKKYCKIEDKNYQLTFYLTISPSGSGEKIIINIIPKNSHLLRLKQLGFGTQSLKLIQRALKRESGLILISSPQGQGKSMTLYSLLQELNSPKRNIYFIGNRLEYELEGVNNLAVSNSNWEKVMNHDSDIIVTEINTEEDFKNASTAAATGRLVLATITANSVWEVLLAYLKLKQPLKLKLDSLKLIINQRLAPLKRANNKTKRTVRVKRREIGLFEILELSPAIKNFLSDSAIDKTKEKFWEKLGRLALGEGYEPLSHDHQKKTKNGLL